MNCGLTPPGFYLGTTSERAACQVGGLSVQSIESNASLCYEALLELSNQRDTDHTGLMHCNNALYLPLMLILFQQVKIVKFCTYRGPRFPGSPLPPSQVHHIV